MSASQPDDPTPAQRWYSLAEQDIALLDRYPVGCSPDIDRDDLDVLDPWVIDGRYAADLPDLGFVEVNDLVAAAGRVVAAVGMACPETTHP